SPQIIYYSDDFGLTWTAAENPLPNNTFELGPVFWSERCGLFIVPNEGNAGGVRVAMSSPDGNTWTATSTPTVSINGVMGITETSSHVVIHFANKTFLSTDGLTWDEHSNSASLVTSGTTLYVPE